METAEAKGMNEHLVASKSRDISDHYKNAFAYHGIIVPEHSNYPGKAYAEGFMTLCRSLAEWVESDMYITDDSRTEHDSGTPG